MNLHQQIAHYASVRARLFSPPKRVTRARERAPIIIAQPVRHPLDDPEHYPSPIGPRRVIHVQRDKYAHRLIDRSPPQSAHQRKRVQHAAVLQILTETAAEYRLPMEAIFGEARHEPLPTIRAIAIHRCLAAGCSYSGIGRAWGRDHTTIRHAALTRGPDGKPLVPRGTGGRRDR